MTEVEQPPQNGIDPTAGEEDDSNKARPADIEQDMREMERRKRVEAIMGSKLFREELERIVDSAREGGAGASGILQQLSDIVGVPVTRVGNVFKSNNCMVPINDIRGVESMGYAKGEKILRCKLAATFRLLDLNGWTQGLGAQITARLKVDQEYFLVNPYGLLYHEITASALNKVDMQGQIVEQGTTNFGVNKSHFVLHSVIHAARPDIRCAIYIGCSPVVAISSLKAGLLPLTKDACVLGEITTHAYTGLFDEEERNRLVRNLGPNSKVMLLTNHGALCCGETIEEAYFAACHIVQACETQLKLLPVGVDNLVLIPEESRKAIYEQSRRPPEDLEKKFAAVTAGDDGAAAAEKDAAEAAATPKIGSPPKWRVGGAEFEALMRTLDNAGYRTGYIYRHPLIKSDPPKPKNDVELPPAVSSLGYLLEEEELFRQGIWKKGDLRKGGDRSRWLNSPNVYQKVEVLETGTPDPKKITKWVAEGSPTHSTPVRIEDPLQFVPAGTNPREFKRVQQQIKDNRRADKISAGPQSHILEGVTWDEASRLKDATVSQTGDHVVMMGAASKGIIQRGFQHNATVYKAPYAKNPFDNVTDDELNEYKRTVERKKKSVHGEYTDTDFSESEAVLQAGTKKYPQSEPETEHQVIEIQTQQAPVPRQAEVVLSDDEEEEEDDKENQQQQQHGRERNLSTNSRCRRDLFPSLGGATNRSEQQHMQQQLYSYVYATTACSMGGPCLQPQVCSALLRSLHSEQLGYLASCYRGAGSVASNGSGSSTSTVTSTLTTAVGGSAIVSRRPLQQSNSPHPAPYRTGSHFGFISPRQPARLEHKHLPGDRDRTGYRPMQRAISYEEIFATPRYEQLCQACFDQLLRLKPGLQRIGAAGTTASSGEEEIASSVASSCITTPLHRNQLLPTLTELVDDEPEEMMMLTQSPKLQRNACTQTPGHPASSSSTTNFLNQIERFNFSEESANVNYSPGCPISSESLGLGLGLEMEPKISSAASATSAAPPRVYRSEQMADVTEVWSFGRWLEPQEQNLAEEGLGQHRILLEVTQHFAIEEQEMGSTESAERQLMSREERQRRKSEFEELWQDHVEFFGAKEQLQLEEMPMSTEQEELEATSLTAQDQDPGLVPEAEKQVICVTPDCTSNLAPLASPELEETLTLVSDELPKILQQFEENLTLAGEHLEKLVATTKRLQANDTTESSVVTSSSSLGESGGPLFRTISLDNIPHADDTVCLVEPDSASSSESDEENSLNRAQNNMEQEEKRDDEKPVSPVSPEPEEPSEKEMEIANEKDVDENENQEAELLAIAGNLPENPAPLDTASTIFTPLEREILERIEADRLDESEAIFGKIDHSIRNKMTPKKLQDLVTEEIFRTRTYIYSSPTSPVPGLSPADLTSTPSGSSMSAHNISAPCNSMAHVQLTTRSTSRLSHSWSEDQLKGADQGEEEEDPKMRTPLQRVISSTTFICRPNFRRKRNFIEENIRNASRPRTAGGSIKKPKSNPNTASRTLSSGSSSVCAFQCGQRDSGARLWVSLPTPPRAAAGHKRANSSSTTTALYTFRGSPSSPFAKRRKPPAILPPLRQPIFTTEESGELGSSSTSMQRTLSSRTFFVRGDSENDSAGTFQMEDASQEEEQEQEEAVNEFRAAPNKSNATNSTMYYSANDNTGDEGENLQMSGEEITGDEMPLTSMSSREKLTEESYIEASSSEIYMGEVTIEKSSSQDNAMKSLMSENQQASSLYHLSMNSNTNEPEAPESELTPETSSQLERESFWEVPRRLEGGSEHQQKSEPKKSCKDLPKSESIEESSGYELVASRELNKMLKPTQEIDSNSDFENEQLLKVVKTLSEEEEEAKEDDNKPSTSKAAAGKQRK
nr:uncharacterized protein LOC108076613 isoform X6 [Drosophila kikkawai]